LLLLLQQTGIIGVGADKIPVCIACVVKLGIGAAKNFAILVTDYGIAVGKPRRFGADDLVLPLGM
jgi:hypothetical protein